MGFAFVVGMHVPLIFARDVAPWIERFARVGFAAKALLYMTVGALAALAALGQGGSAATDQHRAMQWILRAPTGRVLLGVVAIGLVGYAVWRIVEGISDPEGHGRSAKGIALRVRSVVTGLIHGALAISAGRLVLGQRSDGSGSREAQHWTARALATPGGTVLVMLIAGAFVAYGAYQLYCAYDAKLSKKLSFGSLSSPTRTVVIGISRVGIAARGIVFGMIGVLLFRAANDGNPRQAGGVARSLAELFQWGTGPFVGIAVGLVAYGAYQLLNARYLRIDVD